MIRLSLFHLFALLALSVVVPAGSAVAEPGTASDPNLTPFSRPVPEPGAAKMWSLDRLLAIEEIGQVPLGYARCLSQKDAACFRALFHPELPFTYQRPGSPDPLRGGDATVEMFATAAHSTIGSRP